MLFIDLAHLTLTITGGFIGINPINCPRYNESDLGSINHGEANRSNRQMHDLDFRGRCNMASV